MAILVLRQHLDVKLACFWRGRRRTRRLICSLMEATTSQWSELACDSTPQYTRYDWNRFLLQVRIRSVSFCVLPSFEYHVCLYEVLCWNHEPRINSLNIEQVLRSHVELSFREPDPYPNCPITSSHMPRFDPTVALKSPTMANFVVLVSHNLAQNIHLSRLSPVCYRSLSLCSVHNCHMTVTMTKPQCYFTYQNTLYFNY